MDAQTQPQSIQPGSDSPNLVGAIALGLVAAAVSAFVWYGVVVLTHYQIGLVAVGVGFLVGLAVVFGSGGKHGPMLQTLSVLITLPTMALSEYFIDRHFAVAALAKEGPIDVPLFLPASLMMEVIVEGIKESPMTLLFWGIALWTAFKLPGRASQ